MVINPASTKHYYIRITSQSLPCEVKDEIIKINAGCSGSKILQECLNYNLTGLEFIAGVPASLGGMLSMNFGCYGENLSDHLVRVHVLNRHGEDFWLKKDELKFGYRSSNFLKENLIILEAILRLKKSNTGIIRDNIKTFIQKRLKSQPLGSRTFGSIFKNPPDKFSGQILDSLGYKGKKYKNLQISEKHANFLINNGNSEFDDIIEFINMIKEDVYQKTKIKLQPEVIIIK